MGTPNVVIDPITRIEGHLRVECEVENGVIKDAWVSGTLFRGMEMVLKGRAPSDAFYVAQRICGVCPISHGHASTMSAEAGARASRSPTARASCATSSRPRSTCTATSCGSTRWLRSTTSIRARRSRPTSPTPTRWPSRPERPTSELQAVQDKLKTLVAGGQLSIFTNGWFDHPAYSQTMPPELALIGVAHYLEALEMQAEAARVIAIMGGKFPHFMTSLPGGTAWMPDRGEARRHPVPPHARSGTSSTTR